MLYVQITVKIRRSFVKNQFFSLEFFWMTPNLIKMRVTVYAMLITIFQFWLHIALN
jgi:hypothetical protein